jgi:hypothetical protein
MFWLTFDLGEGVRRHRLWSHDTIVGRSPHCDVVIAHPSVSRRHARLTVTAAGCVVTDLSSLHGTWKNGQRVTSVILAPGEAVTLGQVLVHFESGVEPTAERSDNTAVRDPPSAVTQRPGAAAAKRAEPKVAEHAEEARTVLASPAPTEDRIGAPLREHPSANWLEHGRGSGRHDASGRAEGVSASPPQPAVGSPAPQVEVWRRLKAATARLFHGSRSGGTEPTGQRQDGPASQVDPVLLGVSAPRRVAPGASFAAHFAAYIEEAEPEVRANLLELAGERQGDDRIVLGLPPHGEPRWPIGTPVVVRLTGDHLTAAPEQVTFAWNGRKNVASFLVTVDPAAPLGESTHLRFEAFVAGMPVAFVPFAITIGAASTDERAAVVTARPFSTAFASYASQDATLVALGLSWLRRWDLGLEVYMDCLDLTPTERWQRELEAVIPTKDVFLLFWSANAMA